MRRAGSISASVSDCLLLHLPSPAPHLTALQLGVQGCVRVLPAYRLSDIAIFHQGANGSTRGK